MRARFLVVQFAACRLMKHCTLHCPRPQAAPKKASERGGEAKALSLTTAPGALLIAEWFDLVGFNLIAGRRRWLGRGIERRGLPCREATGRRFPGGAARALRG